MIGRRFTISPHVTRTSFAPDLSVDVPEWMVGAPCGSTDPEEFFPEKGGSTKQAKAVCARCDVRRQCLLYALDRDERFGVWGGLSERERRAIKTPAVAA